MTRARLFFWVVMIVMGILGWWALLARAQAQPSGGRGGMTTFYTPGGSIAGKAITAPSGGTTFYAPNGSVTGRASTSPSGTTTFYGPAGNVTGRATAPASRWP